MTRYRTLAAAACCALAVAQMAAAQSATRTYAWYGQLVSLDRATRTVTVTAQLQDHLAPYLGRYKPGDRVVLTWSTLKGEGDVLVFVPSADEMKYVDVGYILPAEFVSVDAAARTMTFKREVPESLIGALASIAPGTWIKATTPMEQPKQVATLTAVVAAAKPAPRPKAGPPVNPRAALEAAAKAPLAAFGGTWTVSVNAGFTELISVCTLTQETTTLTGSCSARGTDSKVTGGVVAGRTVKFQVDSSIQGMTLAFVYEGVLGADGQSVTGSATVFGMDAPFTAKKM